MFSSDWDTTVEQECWNARRERVARHKRKKAIESERDGRLYYTLYKYHFDPEYKQRQYDALNDYNFIHLSRVSPLVQKWPFCGGISIDAITTTDQFHISQEYWIDHSSYMNYDALMH